MGVYKPDELMLIGFLLTLHDTPAKAADALWGLANPSIEDTLTEREVREFLEKISYYAIDVPLKYQLQA